MPLNSLKRNRVLLRQGHKYFKIFPVLIICFVLFVYLYHFADIPFFRMDEGWDLEAPYQLATIGKLASPMLENGGNQSSYFHVHPPFYYVCLAVVFKLFGFGIAQARLFSLFLGALSIGAFISLVRQVNLDRKISKVWILVLFSSVPLFFVLSKTIRPDILMLFLYISSFRLLIKWLQDNSHITLICGALVTSLMMLTHIYGLALLFIWYYYILKKKKVDTFLIYSITFSIPFVPYFLWIATDINSFIAQVLVARDVGSANLWWRMGYIVKILFFVSKRVNVLTYIFMIELIYFAKNYRTIDHKYKNVLMMLPVLFILQFLVLPRFNELYLLLLIPSVLCLMILMINTLNRKFMLAIMSGVLIFNVAGTSVYIYKYHNYNYSEYKRQFHQLIPNHKDYSILGSTSMYPIFYKSKYRAYESYLFHNAEGIHAVIDQSEFVIVDAFVNDTMDKKTLEYIRSKMLLYKSFMSKYYGSEGKHENNMIEIYRKK